MSVLKDLDASVVFFFGTEFLTFKIPDFSVPHPVVTLFYITTNANSVLELGPTFSDICGENIELSDNRKRARWRHKYSAGRLFASRPMRVEEKLEVLLDGSGHVGIGIIKGDPSDLKDLRETGSCKLKLLTDIRVHKRECTVNITLRKENKVSKLDISYSGQKVVLKINNDEKFWLTFELKFGSVVIKMGKSTSVFMIDKDGDRTI